MLKQIWRQLVRLFQRLFNIGTPPQPSTEPDEEVNLTSPLTKVKTRCLSDAEYEQLFMQLLDGVHQGWSRGKIQGFLIAKNLTQADLVVWLQRFGERLRESSQPNEELAQRMVLLSQVGCGELSEVAGEIGRDLLSQVAKTAATKPLENDDIDEAEEWFNQGNELLKKGDFIGAVTSYDQALQLEPDFHEAWYNRGVALVNLGQFEQAITSWDKALQFKPDDNEAWYNRGLVLSNLGQFEQAIASFDKALVIKLDKHEAWINRGIAAGRSHNYDPQAAAMLQLQFPTSVPVLPNPTLTRRGYEGQLLSYEEGLKHCLQNTHPEGWGLLHQAMGNARYFRGYELQGYGDSTPQPYWRKAIESYNQALLTLTEADFPELHLKVLQDYIKPLLGLRETAKADELGRRGTDLLRRLLSDPTRSNYSKKQLALKFVRFQQLTVDIAVQSQQLVQALELAELGKNACLSWLLYTYSDQIASPSYADIQQLLNPTTAIIYWHLSPYALTTFIIKHGADEPIVIKEPLPSPPLRGEGVREEAITLPTPAPSGLRRVQQFETWVKNWDKQYQNYRSSKEKGLLPQPPLVRGEQELKRDWRDNLPELLENLGNLLNISAIFPELSDINQLILIPHRDLHRLPLQALFPNTFTLTYLPSAQIGITLSNSSLSGATPSKSPLSNGTLSNSPLAKEGWGGNLLSVEHPNSKDLDFLPYAEIESAAISQLFNNPTRLSGQAATKTAVQEALTQDYKIFHFTGHGTYNFDRPKHSALALSQEDYLTLEEICNIPFSSYQLVSLSACETALTGNQTIENEYVGLVSAFVYQRVTSVVSTLWTVNDIFSALLMIEFYRRITEQVPPTIALKQAQYKLRRLTNQELANWCENLASQLPNTALESIERLETKARIIRNNPATLDLCPFDEPYYWACFIITGKINI